MISSTILAFGSALVASSCSFRSARSGVSACRTALLDRIHQVFPYADYFHRINWLYLEVKNPGQYTERSVRFATGLRSETSRGSRSAGSGVSKRNLQLMLSINQAWGASEPTPVGHLRYRVEAHVRIVLEAFAVHILTEDQHFRQVL